MGYIPPAEEIKRLLIEGYEKILGIKLIRSGITELERRIWEKEIKPKHISREWLYMHELRHSELVKGRAVKIADALHIY